MDQQQDIEKIAYKLYLDRQGNPGDPLQDWLTAEKIYEGELADVIEQTQSERESDSVAASAEPADPASKKTASRSAAKKVPLEKKTRR